MHGRANLTPKQATVYRFIVEGYRTGEMPTQQEIGDMIGVTKVTVFEHITALAEKGYVVRSTKARGIMPAMPLDERYVEIETPTTLLANAAMALTTAMDTEDRQKYQRFISRLESAAAVAQA